MQNLFETNFIATLRKVFTSGTVHNYGTLDGPRVISSMGEVYKINRSTIPLLHSSKIDDEMLNEIRTSVNFTVSEIENVADGIFTSVNSQCEHSNTCFTLVQVGTMLHMIATIASYDMINDHVKPMLECFFILDAVAYRNKLECGDIFIMAGDSFIKEIDESIAYELIRRFTCISDTDTVKKLYFCEEHEENYKKVIDSMKIMSSNLDKIKNINESNDRNFDAVSMPSDSIEVLKTLNKEDVDGFIANARKSIETEENHVTMLNEFVETNRDFFENIVKHSDVSPSIVIEDGRVCTENYYALPALLK